MQKVSMVCSAKSVPGISERSLANTLRLRQMKIDSSSSCSVDKCSWSSLRFKSLSISARAAGSKSGTLTGWLSEADDEEEGCGTDCGSAAFIETICKILRK